MEDSGGGYGEGSSPTVVRWVAPVDPITGEADTRLCFLYADLWRRVVDPGMEDLEPLQAWSLEGAGHDERAAAVYRERVAPQVYDAVIGSVLSVVQRLDLRYETSDQGGRCSNF